MTVKKTNGGLVYSSEYGRMCPGCNRPKGECACARKTSAPPADGVVRVSRQTKGRKGKAVTLVTGVPLDEAGLKALATRLKQQCGCGGTVKDGVIEIQGDHAELLLVELRKLGWTVKRAGG